MISIDKTLAACAQAHRDKPFFKHPLWVGLIKGKFSKKQMQEFARQFGIIPLHNHHYHAPLYINCPNYKWRAQIAEVVYEEGTGKLHAGGIPHNELYLHFGKELGLSAKELLEPDYCVEALAFKSYFIVMVNRSFLEGVSVHMLGSEAQGPGVFTKMAETFKRKYGLTNKGVNFWVVHDEADEEHSDVGRKLLEEFAPTDADRKLAIKCVKEMIDMSFLLYDGIYRRMQNLS